MSVTEANRVKRHYEVLLEKLTFEREAGRLTSIEKFRTEAFTVARGARAIKIEKPVKDRLFSHFGFRIPMAP